MFTRRCESSCIQCVGDTQCYSHFCSRYCYKCRSKWSHRVVPPLLESLLWNSVVSADNDNVVGVVVGGYMCYGQRCGGFRGVLEASGEVSGGF